MRAEARVYSLLFLDTHSNAGDKDLIDNLETKALSKFIENEPLRLSREQVQAMSSALSSHIRAQTKT
ncbi:MAG: hypothetical protein CVU24_08260 [Betaproteobacteria bacterium HGW-Betaproteobacteria-18]|nr:MAG: hypothetical protein CVU24_08260 [Betaproteobacteria bacterium HGW-Betaproteobacteria-18]